LPDGGANKRGEASKKKMHEVAMMIIIIADQRFRGCEILEYIAGDNQLL
jgi:hypothetical protein